jgi:hypothetical protein
MLYINYVLINFYFDCWYFDIIYFIVSYYKTTMTSTSTFDITEQPIGESNQIIASPGKRYFYQEVAGYVEFTWSGGNSAIVKAFLVKSGRHVTVSIPEIQDMVLDGSGGTVNLAWGYLDSGPFGAWPDWAMPVKSGTVRSQSFIIPCTYTGGPGHARMYVNLATPPTSGTGQVYIQRSNAVGFPASATVQPDSINVSWMSGSAYNTPPSLS